MLNRNFAIALAVAMVLAVLYGCSSSGGIKNDRDMYKEDAEMLQGSLDAANGEVTADGRVGNRHYERGGSADRSWTPRWRTRR